MNYIKHITSLLLALLLFTVTSVNAAESITYIHADHLGSPIAATNEDGSVKWREDYQPFGVQRTNQDSDNATGFTGHQHDDALELTYMQARWYHPDVGRFMALDPIVFRASDLSSFGRYTYAANNPYYYIDPDGQQSEATFDRNVRYNHCGQSCVNSYNNNVWSYDSIDQQTADAIVQPLISMGEEVIPGKGFSDGTQSIENGNYISGAVDILSEVPALKLLKASKFGKRACCFVAGTQVLTKKGYRNIEDVELGQQLWAKNIETGEEGWKPVTKVWIEPNRGIFDIRLVAQDGFEQKIEATDDHPFFVVGHGWKTTIELNAGDKIESKLGEPLVVKSVKDEKRTDVTYNFTVADFHTYYVTKRNVLVHNCNKKSPNQMNQYIKKGKAPKGVVRVDTGKVKGEQTHAHFKNGSALNKDGSWKHGSSKLTGKQKTWLKSNGWTLPEK